MARHPGQPDVRPAPGTRIFFLGHEGVLFSEPRQELHRLNTTASVIWCLLEEGWTEARMARDLATRFNIRAPEATAFVSSAISDWAGKGLLAGTVEPPQPTPSGGRPGSLSSINGSPVA